MTIKVLMPALSPTMTEGTLAKWLKKEGDKIEPGEVIAEIETDKAIMEVESADSGIIGKLLVAEGSTGVKVNQLIAIILEDGEDIANVNTSEIQEIKTINQHNANSVKNEKEELNIRLDSPSKETKKLSVSPLAKRIAENSRIDLSLIEGTGPHGRIIKADVLDFSKDQSENTAANNQIPLANSEVYRAVDISSMRKIIAERLLYSKQNIPHFYLNSEYNVDKLVQLRAQLNEQGKSLNNMELEYKISVNDLVVKATSLALRAVPELNSAWDEDKILRFSDIDISIAVAIQDGLITPIVRKADTKSISMISNEIKALSKKAQERRLSPEEFQGGGFSISNLGMYGVKSFNAIINPPQSCIMAVGAIIKKPVVDNDNQIKVANVMEITLSCDHRIIDGAIAAKFLLELRRYIENPLLILV